jgi:hypothetical protein
MNGVVIESMASIGEACAADAVVVGSGMLTREVIRDQAIMGQLRQLDPSRLLAGQYSGTLVLARLGLLAPRGPPGRVARAGNRDRGPLCTRGCIRRSTITRVACDAEDNSKKHWLLVAASGLS